MVSSGSRLGPVRDRYARRGGRDGRSLACAGHTAESRGGREDPAVSPDKRWLVFSARERNRTGLYVRRVDLQGTAALVASEGSDARWTADGKDIVFRVGEQVMASAFTGDDEPHPGQPRELFSIEGLKTFDVIPGGRDLIAVVGEPGSGIQTRISMVQNWFQEIR